MTDFQRNSASAVPGIQPLAYLNPNQPSNTLSVRAHRAPTQSDRKYKIPTIWIHIDTNEVWCLTSVVSNVANWEPIGQNTAGSSPLSKYVVAADGTADYLTIQNALDAANASGINSTIYVRPGIYTENLILYGTTQIIGATGLSDGGTGVEITGTHTPPINGSFTFRNIKLNSATNIFNSSAAGTSHLIIADCAISVTNGYLLNVPNWTGILELWDVNCGFGTNDGVINNINGATVLCFSGSFGKGTANNMIISGSIFTDSAEFFIPINMNAGTQADIFSSTFNGTIITSGNANVRLSNCAFSTSVSQAITHNSSGTLNISTTTISSSANPAISGTGAGSITLNGVDFENNSNIAPTLSIIYPSESRPGKIIVGDSTASKPNTYTDDQALIQAFGIDPSTGSTSRKAFLANIDAQGGDGNSTPKGIDSTLTSSSGSYILQGYANFNYANQKDGSQVVSILSGCLGQVYIEETDAADQPQSYLCGVKSILSAADSAASPTLNNQASSIGVVNYDAPFNTTGCGFIATRDGANTGTTAKAAFKVVQGNKAVSDWQYGLDLYNESGTQNYGVADIRFWDQATLATAASTTTFSCATNKSFSIILGDSAGANTFNIIDSNIIPVTTIDSNGNISAVSVDVSQSNEGAQLQASGDLGGVVGRVSFTNVYSGVAAGIGTVLMNSNNSANSSGWIKIYVEGNARYIPFWTTNTP